MCKKRIVQTSKAITATLTEPVSRVFFIGCRINLACLRIFLIKLKGIFNNILDVNVNV